MRLGKRKQSEAKQRAEETDQQKKIRLEKERANEAKRKVEECIEKKQEGLEKKKNSYYKTKTSLQSEDAITNNFWSTINGKKTNTSKY